MQYVVVDLEATCWAAVERRPRDQMEIIEIGAVRLDDELRVVEEFEAFVRPVVSQQLSEFCVELTTITQAQVDAADAFPVVFARFVDWIGNDPHQLVSWGAYDLGQLELDCRRSGVALPPWMPERHVNLKQAFSAWQGSKRRFGMARALARLGMPLEGVHHRGIGDARNIARIAQSASS